MELTLDLFGKICGSQLTLPTRCPTLSRMMNFDLSVERGTGDCGGDSESWVYYSVLKQKADNVSVQRLDLSTFWDQTLLNWLTGLE